MCCISYMMNKCTLEIGRYCRFRTSFHGLLQKQNLNTSEVANRIEFQTTRFSTLIMTRYTTECRVPTATVDVMPMDHFSVTSSTL